MSTKTKGAEMMGIEFIPGNNNKKQNILEKCAHVIDDLESLKTYRESDKIVSEAKIAAIHSAQEDIFTAGLKAAAVAEMV
jgi:hypothetical protein